MNRHDRGNLALGWTVRQGIVAALLFGALVALAPAAVVRAATTFTVNSTDDAPDVIPGDGICNAATRGIFRICTLRAAITEGNAAGGPATIALPAGAYQLNHGDLNGSNNGNVTITGNLTIAGAGAATTTIEGKLFSGAVPPGTPVTQCFFQAALCIADTASAVVSDVTVTTVNLPPIESAGIYARGALTVKDSLFTGNDVGIWNHEDPHPLTLMRSTFANNRVGIQSYYDGPVTVTDSTLRNNSNAGVYALIDGYTPHTFVLTVTRSTFSDNGTDGLQITLDGSDINTDVTTVAVTNSTFGGNGQAGLSLFGNVTLSNDTVVSNGYGVGIDSHLAAIDGSYTVRNTIIGNNTTNCGNEAQSLSSGGYNIVNGSSCTFVGATDLNANLNLGPLASNGGPTQTYAPLAGSPAIDRIPIVGGCNGAGVTTDQRGVARPAGVRCDVGSVEVLPSALPGGKPSAQASGSPTGLPAQRTPGQVQAGGVNPIPQSRP